MHVLPWGRQPRVPQVAAEQGKIEAFLQTGITNARTECYNRIIKQTKRVARGFRNPDQLRAAHHAPHRGHPSRMITSGRCPHPGESRRAPTQQPPAEDQQSGFIIHPAATRVFGSDTTPA